MWILSELKKYKIEMDFLPLFHVKSLIDESYEVFNLKRPKTIVFPNHLECQKDTECNSIQRDFGEKQRDDLCDSECVDILLSLSLISDEAFFYFLPRLLKFIFLSEGGGHEERILFRLESNQENFEYKKHKEILKIIEEHINLKIQAIERIEEIENSN